MYKIKYHAHKMQTRRINKKFVGTSCTFQFSKFKQTGNSKFNKMDITNNKKVFIL